MHAVRPYYYRAVLDAPVRAVHRYAIIGYVYAYDALPHVDARLGRLGKAIVQRLHIVWAMCDTDAVSMTCSPRGLAVCSKPVLTIRKENLGA